MSDPNANHLQNELREAFMPWLLLPHGILGAFLAIFDPLNAPPPSLSALGALMLLLCALVLLVRKAHHYLAAWLLCLGSLAILLVAHAWYPQQGVLQALVLPIIMGALTIGPVGAVLLVLFCGSSLILVQSQGSPLTIPWVALAVLCCTALYLGLDRRSQRTMLRWAWDGYAQAQRHLHDARDRQLELKQALEDLALVTRQTVRLNGMLAAARQAVEEARKAKEEFVANVSHELRTPLNMIIGFSDMILESPEVYGRRLPPALLADVAAIKRNSHHLASLVDDVLDLSEAETGHMQLVREWVSLGEVASEAVEAVAALFDKKALTLEVHLPEDLPLVWCDRTRVRQVLLNLLSNAGRFTERGGCRVSGSVEDGVVTIEVADTGPGMGPDTLVRMFEPFQQGEPSLRRRYGGTGLGLSISKRFVELHGGKIWLESRLGKGTKACFSLPIENKSLLPQGSAPDRWFNPYADYEPRDRPSAAPALASNPQVIILEEGAALREMITRYVDDLEVLPATSLEEACALANRDAAVALLINQINAGVGVDSLDVLPQLTFDVPVIWCWVPEKRAAFRQLGAQDYLVKPVARDDLMTSIGQVAPQARTILLVDDDVEAQQLFRRMLALEHDELMVLIAEDGESALRMMRERRPDLVLLDLIMPNMDGFAVLEIKAQDQTISDIPVIVLSAMDPQRQPIVTKSLTVSRQQGLSARDLAAMVQAVTQTLRPRFGAPVHLEAPGA
jgi:signal transduction histidine kinase/DNA-binding response OmpR family regulator